MNDSDKYRILVIDDEKTNLMVLNKILSPEYAVFTAKSGEEGLSRVASERPDLILMDIIMPGMNGFEVLKTLKDNPETLDIPVIIITGLDNDLDEEKGLLLGAVDYISKPFKDHIVIARVRTHIQIVQHIRMIERLGLMDPLTGIPNRRCFDNHLAVEWGRAIREKQPISFMMMDVDKFKSYNDTYGHPQGDTLLRAVAKIIASEAKRPSDMAVRLGGEEFGLLLANTDLQRAVGIAEKIRANVEAKQIPTSDGKTMTSTTISIGVVSTVPNMGESMGEFIARADEYLYTAKNTGRNRIYAEQY